MRITNKDLEAVVARINRTMGTPQAPYIRNEATGRHEPQANCYHLDYAYGGVSLHRMSDMPGCTGVDNVFSIGHVSKRELYDRMQAFLRGVEAARGN